MSYVNKIPTLDELKDRGFQSYFISSRNSFGKISQVQIDFSENITVTKTNIVPHESFRVLQRHYDPQKQRHT